MERDVSGVTVTSRNGLEDKNKITFEFYVKLSIRWEGGKHLRPVTYYVLHWRETFSRSYKTPQL